MKVLPQVIAIGAIHSGTMKGKLNGVMPTTHPQRIVKRLAVLMPVRTGVVAHRQRGNAAGELDHLDAARDFALRRR